MYRDSFGKYFNEKFFSSRADLSRAKKLRRLRLLGTTSSNGVRVSSCRRHIGRFRALLRVSKSSRRKTRPAATWKLLNDGWFEEVT